SPASESSLLPNRVHARSNGSRARSSLAKGFSTVNPLPVACCPLDQSLTLFADARGSRASQTGARIDGSGHRQHLTHPWGQRRMDLAQFGIAQLVQSDAAQFCPTDALPRSLVGDTERDALPDQPFGQVGRERETRG